MADKEIEKNRVQAGIQLIVRIVATTAIWSIAFVISFRLRHILIDITVIGVAAAVTLLIWTHQPKK